jgi:iron only hydrogenase large subunit-like protein/NAD-dependent dihydropyrimidine dehydrogenase PreA subunit
MICMRQCPTQAIRVRQGKASILEDLCVDCGTCISACPSGGITPITDPMDGISSYKYKVVIPSSVLYSQFGHHIHPYIIHLAFLKLGFDNIVDVGPFCAILAKMYVEYLKDYRGRLPLISNDCPAMIRLIQVRFPDLVEQIIPFDVPRELAAHETRNSLVAELGLRPEDIGITYVSPCPAKVVSVKQPAEKPKSWFDGVVAIKDVYSSLFPQVMAIKANFDEKQVPRDFSFNAGWSMLGGITRMIEMENWLAVAGVDHVIKIFNDIENSRLRNIDFVEAMVCILGCVGGPFNVENPYVVRTNSIKQRARYESPIDVNQDEIRQRMKSSHYFLESKLLPRTTTCPETDLKTSIKKIRERDRVYQKLRQIDCGCCGAPTCKAFAEDFVRGEVELSDCIFFSSGGGER